MKFLTGAILRLPEYRVVSDAVASNRLPACATGLSGIHKAHVISALCEEHHKKALVIAGDEAEATRLEQDLKALGLSTAFYPYRDFGFRNVESSSREYEQQRLGVLAQILTDHCDVVLCCADGALQYTMPPNELRRRIATLHTGDKVSPAVLTGLLTAAGYERVAQVESIGQYALRGGILDLCVPGDTQPVRIEFWGDEIDTISEFELESQRRGEVLESVTVSPSTEVPVGDPEGLAEEIEAFANSLRSKTVQKAREILQLEADRLRTTKTLGSVDKFYSLIFPTKACLLDYVREDRMIFLSEYVKVRDRYRSVSWQNGEDIKEFLEDGVLCRGLDEFSMDWPHLLGVLEDKPTVYLENFAHGNFETPIRALTNFTARQLSVWSGDMQLLREDLDNILGRQWACAVLAGTEKAARSLADDLREQNYPAEYAENPESLLPGKVLVLPGGFSSGMEYPGCTFSVITHGIPAQKRKNRRKIKQGQDIQSLSELKFGDFVVHSIHGIGVFEGIHKIEL